MASSRSFSWWFAVLVCTALCGCGDDDGTTPDDAGSPDSGGGGPVVRCSADDDPDGDYISSMDEGSGDPDGDGDGNDRDDDSDGDGFSDRDEAGDSNCLSPPVDTDGDGSADYLDLDANGDGVPDREQRETDTDGDGTPDYRDDDIDGDGILNRMEIGEGGVPVDTDMDGTPDVRDDDSDGDSIVDRHEGGADTDRDGTPNFRDLDSDGDGVEDNLEAGDGDPATPPRACAEEINPRTREVEADGHADYADADSDNDGLGDGEELRIGTQSCNIDSDGDGFDDLVEGAYVRVNCPMGTGDFCDCATNSGCTIPADDYYVVLPYMDPAVERDLDFGTTIRVADIFYITDTTGSMSGTVMNVQRTVTRPGGLIDRIAEVIPDAWHGGGQHDDMPFGSYGSPPDEPFILAIGMTPPERRTDVQTAFAGIVTHGGADGPESQTEALYQIITGEGGMWTGPGAAYTMRRYAGDCLDTGYGAPCFREAALPIIIHFTDICSHNGPPGEDGTCDPYVGITPAPHTWAEAIMALNARGAKYVGVNASGSTCVGVVGPSGYLPCFFMKRTAEETGSVDLDGNPLVYDLPNASTESAFIDTITGAIETIATRVPLDVDTGLRNDPMNIDGVDATRFIKRRVPRCRAVPAEECWTAPMGVAHDAAVAAYDESTFFGVIPGTQVRFRITFQNDFRMGDVSAQVFVAYIDVRGGGSAILDTRQVYIVVPASDGPPII